MFEIMFGRLMAETSLHSAGRYEFSLRIRLDDNLRWPQYRYQHNNDAAQVTTLRACSLDGEDQQLVRE